MLQKNIAQQCNVCKVETALVQF